MRISVSLLASVVALSLFSVGCAGPEAKLGRGMNNMLEFGRMGELRSSIESNTLFANPEHGRTYGFIHGLHRSMARTFVGAYEVVTFPFPSYDPIFKPVATVYPSSYRPGVVAGPLFDTDSTLGFRGCVVAPILPVCNFRVFHY